MRQTVVSAALLAVLACGDGSPASPSSQPPPQPSPPAPQTWTIAGSIIDAVSGAPVQGATVAVSGRDAVTTDGAGGWQIQGTGVVFAPFAASISAPGYITRETAVRWRADGRQDVALDLLPDRPPFSLDFYRQLVRNAHEAPEELQPLRRWDANPNFYINTFNPRTGQPIEQAELDTIVRALHDSVPQLTGGRLTVGTVEAAPAERAPRLGYININIVYDPGRNFCGEAFVGANPGEIWLNYDGCSSCGGLKLPARVVAHEVGHALGFWHVSEGVMGRFILECSKTKFTELERLHARMAYGRPRGNTDPDRDPPDFLASTHGTGPRVLCPGR